MQDGMKVAVVHNAVAETASEAERDVLAQVSAVADALSQRGDEVRTFGATLDLGQLQRELRDFAPACVFNLVESLGGSDRLMTLPCQLFEVMGLPYTGTGAAALLLANDKLAAKRAMRAGGVPTPSWWTREDGWQGPRPERAIVKAISEHASIGLCDASVIRVEDEASLGAAVEAAQLRTGHAHFAEAFVEGREFNVSVLALETLRVLPIAEIDFTAFAPDKPRIVGHDAKWTPGSFEYEHTPRTFRVEPELAEHVGGLAARACRIFGLRGHVRVDIRLDERDSGYVLEVNANPCLSPDAGYAAALAQASIPFATTVAALVDFSVRSGR